MSEFFIGEIRRVAFNFAPKYWALCNGQLLSIAQNQALFSLLGTSYGGNGVNTFALPDLRGSAPIHAGGSIVQGESGGAARHTLTSAQMPAHSHTVAASSAAASVTSPQGAYFAASPQPGYGVSAAATMAADSIGIAGGNQPHENRPPYLAVNYIIALTGIFPSRN